MSHQFYFHKSLFHRSFGVIVCSIFILSVHDLNAQNFAWAKQMGGSNATANTSMGQIKIDAAGNIFQTISSTSAIDVDPGPGVFNFTGGAVKLSPAGNLIWARQIPGAFVLDASGNIYSTGNFSGTRDFDPGPGVVNLTSFGYDDVFIVKFDVNGNLVWAKQVGGNFMEGSGGIALSANGLIVTGGFGFGGNISPINSCDFDPDPLTSYSLTNAGSYDGFILTLDFDGQFVSVLQKGTTADESVGNICIDNSGNFIYQYGGQLEKSDPDNNVLWSIDISALTWAMAPFTLDADGNILISGGYMGTFDFDPGPGVTMVPSVTMWGSLVQAPYISKFDANGNFLWVKTLYANGFATGVTSDAAGNVYTVGHFYASGNVDFDPGPGAYNLKVAARAGYVQKLSPAGNLEWATKIGGEIKTETFGRAIGLGNLNEVYTSYEFKGAIDADPGAGKFTLKAVGTKDVMLHKMTQSISSPQRSADMIVSEPDLFNEIKAYPNPNNGSFYVDVPAISENATLEIYTMSGQLILRRSFNGKNAQRLYMNKSITAAGLYTLQITGRDRTFNAKIVVQ